MAEIRNFGFVRHLRAEPTSHIIKFKKGRVHRSERGIWRDTPDSTRHLVEVEGFIEADDPRFSDLTSGDGDAIVHVSVAGAFARPVGEANGDTSDAPG